MSDHAELVAIVTAEGIAEDRALHLVRALLGSAWIAHRDRLIQASERERIATDIATAGRAKVEFINNARADVSDRACIVATEDAYRHAITIARTTTEETP